MLEPARPLKELLRDPVDPARTQAVWQRLRERRTRHVRPALGLAFVAASAAAAFGLWLAVRDSPAIDAAGSDRPAPLALRLHDGGPIPARVASGDAPRGLVFSDASSIELEPGSELRALRSTGRAFETELRSGGALFAVTPGGPRRWSVRVGSVEVRVVGTRFRVQHVAPRAIEVSVEHGVVTVRGATVATGERRLVAGQRLRVLTEVESSAPVAVAAPVAPDEARDNGPRAEPPIAEDVKLAVPARPHATTTQAPPPTQATVVQAPPPPPPQATAARGTSAQPSARQATAAQATAAQAPATVDELLATADRHRAAGDPAQAARALERLLAQDPGDARAPLAALTLGRLYVQLGRPTDAVSMIERAQQLGLPKALAEEGAAFLVLAHARAGDAERARVAAERYRSAFPYGRWSASVREWVGGH